MATISKEELQECFLGCYDSGYYKKLNENKIKEFYNYGSIQYKNKSGYRGFVVSKRKDRYFALEHVNYNSINCRVAYDLLYEVEPKVKQITEWIKKK